MCIKSRQFSIDRNESNDMRLEKIGNSAHVLHSTFTQTLFSYETAVAEIEWRSGVRHIRLSAKWNCSRTTTKHVSQFLGLNVEAIRKGISKNDITVVEVLV